MVNPSLSDDTKEVYFRHELEILRHSTDSVGNVKFLTTLKLMAGLCTRQGRYDEAKAYLREEFEAKRRVMGDDDLTTLIFNNAMGGLNHLEGKYHEAEYHYTEALEGFRRIIDGKYGFCKPHRVLAYAMPDSIWTINSLVKLYDDWGKDEAAQKYREMLPEDLDLSRSQ